MIIGCKVYRTKITYDSMAWAKEHLEDAPDGAVFLADSCGAARGRDGRIWNTYPGQLTVTMMLKPQTLSTINRDDLPIRLNQLSMAISIGILEPLKAYGAQLKWPNDFVINDKKMGGILIHLVWHAGQPRAIIVGFSLNINNIFDASDPLCKTATSLAYVTSQQQDLRALYKKMLSSINTWYAVWSSEAFSEIYRAWKTSQACIGKKMQVHEKGGTVKSGTALQVLPNGDLIILDEQHKQNVVSFYQVEEVHLVT